MNNLKCLLVLITASIFIGACGDAAKTPNAAATPAATNTTAVKATPQSAPAIEAGDDTAAGKELYAINCMICHKDSGKGGKVTIDGKALEPDDLTSAKTKKKSDEKLHEQITAGVPDEGMPAFSKKLSADEIKTIVKYIRTLQSS